MVADMEFFYGICSGNSSRVAFALHEAGVSYEAHALHVPRGESRSEAYLKLNPMGKVPALVDGNVELWESNAINWYIAESHPGAALLPATIAGRAAVQRWLFFQTAHVSPACMPIYIVSNPRVKNFWGFPGSQEAADNGRRDLARFLPVLERVLAKHEWLEGAFSIADIAYAPHFWLLSDAGFDFSATPAVQSWLTRLLDRPAWQRARAMIYGD